jgi:hypothetical protein
VKSWLLAVNTNLRAEEDAIQITEKVARKALKAALFSYVKDKKLSGCKEEDLKVLCRAVEDAEKKKKKDKKLKLEQSSVASVAEMSKAELGAFVDQRIAAFLAKEKAEKKKKKKKKLEEILGSISSSSSSSSSSRSSSSNDSDSGSA